MLALYLAALGAFLLLLLLQQCLLISLNVTGVEIARLRASSGRPLPCLCRRVRRDAAHERRTANGGSTERLRLLNGFADVHANGYANGYANGNGIANGQQRDGERRAALCGRAAAAVVQQSCGGALLPAVSLRVQCALGAPQAALWLPRRGAAVSAGGSVRVAAGAGGALERALSVALLAGPRAQLVYVPPGAAQSRLARRTRATQRRQPRLVHLVAQDTPPARQLILLRSITLLLSYTSS